MNEFTVGDRVTNRTLPGAYPEGFITGIIDKIDPFRVSPPWKKRTHRVRVVTAPTKWPYRYMWFNPLDLKRLDES